MSLPFQSPCFSDDHSPHYQNWSCYFFYHPFSSDGQIIDQNQVQQPLHHQVLLETKTLKASPPTGTIRICILIGPWGDLKNTLKFEKHPPQFKMPFKGRAKERKRKRDRERREGKKSATKMFSFHSCLIGNQGLTSIVSFPLLFPLYFFPRLFLWLSLLLYWRATWDRELGSLPTILSMWE